MIICNLSAHHACLFCLVADAGAEYDFDETMVSIIDLSTATGIPAGPTAPLPSFPSNAQFVTPRFKDLCLGVLAVTSRERTHVNLKKWGDVIALLWGAGPGSLIRRSAQWEPKQQSRQIRERALAAVHHFSSFSSVDPTQHYQQLASFTQQSTSRFELNWQCCHYLSWNQNM